MIRPIAVLDTDIIILLLDRTNDKIVGDWQAYIGLTIENLKKQKARFVIPAPVVAELCKDGPGSAALREISREILGKIRVEVLDEDAADVAGQMVRMALRAREGRERGAVKFDTLIAAIAHKIGARWLLTHNVKDMRRCLSVVSSSVEILVATDPPATGQQVTVQMLQPTKVAEAPSGASAPRMPRSRGSKKDPGP